ncbi:hypothetical protein GV819_07685 [Pseudomonas sp. Fl5BN2]|uniref:hypothetical protein n=1 Tax=Pseudomonas sp. Fl5BN2 TaxID=2697652 RepID=UPI0013775750|nr:hypothetical protein [Pseudomonas sp. Fl5BN2]NBF02172.1 hypothetical protein [Pseudomonas sp. Fl5BN2]
MKINNIIIPGVSIGGVSIGEQIDNIAKTILKSEHLLEKTPNALIIINGLITAYHDSEGIISAVSCNEKFQGKYMDKLWPGITVSEVLANSKAQMAWSGFVQVDQLRGVGLSLPEELDDFESLSDILDPDYVFNELWVYGF